MHTITCLFSVLHLVIARPVLVLERRSSAVLRGRFMQELANELRRIPLPRTWVNKGKKNSWGVFSGTLILLGRFTTG